MKLLVIVRVPVPFLDRIIEECSFTEEELGFVEADSVDVAADKLGLLPMIPSDGSRVDSFATDKWATTVIHFREIKETASHKEIASYEDFCTAICEHYEKHEALYDELNRSFD